MDHSNAKDPSTGKISATTPRAPAPTKPRNPEPAGVAARPNVVRPPAPPIFEKADGDSSGNLGGSPAPLAARSASDAAPSHEPFEWFGPDDEPTGERPVEATLVEPRAPRTLVEEGTELRGSLASACPIEVKGRVEGDVTAPSLTVAASGAVHGKVKVGELRSEGEIAGEVDADVARVSGVVKGATVLRTKSLEMKLAPVGKRIQLTFVECTADIGAEVPK